jgi:ATP-dependent RNA helicase DeaD
MAWGDLKVSAPIAESLATMGYASPSEVQSQSIPPLQQGKDMVGQAVTGTGKTAAFGIPMCELIDTSSREVQGLVLVPTRELAMQVTREISRIGEARGIQVLAVYGGQPIARQIRVLEDGAPIVVGTPGRIKDHMNRRTLDLSTVKFAVLDEADEMLDIGFADDMEYILRFTPSSRQTALFSATIPRFLLRLINRYLHDPEWVRLVSEFAATDTVDEVDQYYFEVAERDKPDAVREVLGDMEDGPQVLIFRRMQVGVDRLEQDLKRAGYPARGIHGGLSQGERNSVMGSFRDGSLRILVATNVAARGLDIPTITHVINYDMPESAEEYVHRVGRTARMGNRGTAISFVGEWDLVNLDRVLSKVGEEKIERKMLALYDTQA